MTGFKASDNEGVIFVMLILANLWISHGVYAQNTPLDRLDAYVSIGTADIYRGLRRHDHALAVQGEIRWRFNESLFVGAHLSPTEFSKGRFGVSSEIEFDYYIGWWQQVSSDVAWQVRFRRNTYPGSNDQFVEYDYNELLVGVDLPHNFSMSLSLSDESLTFSDSDAYAQMLWHSPKFAEIEFSAAIGGVRSLHESSRSYAYWDAGVSTGFGSVVVDLRYHHAAKSLIWMGRETVRANWALNVTWGW